jgi:hypothetical protein
MPKTSLKQADTAFGESKQKMSHDATPLIIFFRVSFFTWPPKLEMANRTLCLPASPLLQLNLYSHLFPPLLLDTEPAAWLPPPSPSTFIVFIALQLGVGGWGSGANRIRNNGKLAWIDFWNSANVVFIWILKMGFMLSRSTENRSICFTHFPGIFLNLAILVNITPKFKENDR